MASVLVVVYSDNVLDLESNAGMEKARIAIGQRC